MEILAFSKEKVCIYLDGLEYLATLRPQGLLARAVELDPALSKLIDVDLSHEGAVLSIPAECVSNFIDLAPTHACDDRLRLLLSQYSSGLHLV